MTTTQVTRFLGAMVCVAAVVFCAPVCAGAAGNGGRGGGEGGAHGGQRIEQALAKIAEHIQEAQKRLAEHPNCPPAVKSAADKLLGDLNTAKDGLEQAKTALTNKDRTALQGMREKLHAQRGTIKADFEALKNAVNAAKEEKGRGGLQRGGHQPIGA